MKNRILTIVAHPDDEVLGAGATLKKHSENGDEVYCVYLADGVSSRSNSKENLEKRRKEIKESSEILGFKEIFVYELEDNKMDLIPLLDIIKIIESIIQKIKPNIIYTHHSGDLNVDHRKTYEAVMTACRPCNFYSPREIRTFEVLSSTEWQFNENHLFKPNIFVNIENEIEFKIKAMQSYNSELRKYPHSRSLEGIEILAKYRGLQSNLKYAEAFRIERKIIC
jgi:N-acetylglucosamine malate deacetylase 1